MMKNPYGDPNNNLGWPLLAFVAVILLWLLVSIITGNAEQKAEALRKQDVLEAEAAGPETNKEDPFETVHKSEFTNVRIIEFKPTGTLYVKYGQNVLTLLVNADGTPYTIEQWNEQHEKEERP